MDAYVTITRYGDRAVTVCTRCGTRTDHGADDRAAAFDAARHNAEGHRAA